MAQLWSLKLFTERETGKKCEKKLIKVEGRTQPEIYTVWERDKKPLYVAQKMAENLTKNGTKFFRDG